MEIFNTVIEFTFTYLPAITGVIAAASAITALTPTTVDDRVIDTVLKVLNFLSLNVGKNTNADAVSTDA